MSAGSWIKFAMLIGDGKPELAKLVEIAECYEDTDSDTHTYSEKNLRKFPRIESRMDSGTRRGECSWKR